MITLLFSLTACGLGETHDSDASDPEPPAEKVKYKQVVVGNTQACALREDGTVVCWGATEEEIEQGTLDYYYHDGKAPSGLFSHLSFSGFPRSGHPTNSASGRGCGIDLEKERICCWGRADFGRSANKECSPALTATPGQKFVAVVNSETHLCGLDDSGDLYCHDDSGKIHHVSNIREIAGSGYSIDAITSEYEYLRAGLFITSCASKNLFDSSPEQIPAEIDAPALVEGLTGCFWSAATGQIRCDEHRMGWTPGPGMADAAGVNYTTCAIYESGAVRCETPSEYDVDPEGIIDNWPPDPPGQFKQIALWPDSASVGCGITLDDELSCWGSPSGQARGIIERAP
jgi:hypothetical protein